MTKSSVQVINGAFCQQQKETKNSPATINKTAPTNNMVTTISELEQARQNCSIKTATRMLMMSGHHHREENDKLAKIKEEHSDTMECDRDDCKHEGRVDSFDHVTFWVGNAKQSAVFYMTQFGFQPMAFRGLETGSRDLACHVVKLNDTIIQFVSAVEPNNTTLNKFLLSHGDAVKDVAFRVSNIENLLEHSLKQGAELASPLEVITFGANNKSDGGELDKFVLKRATIKTFGDVTHTFIERNYEYGPASFLPGYKKASLEVSLRLIVR